MSSATAHAQLNGAQPFTPIPVRAWRVILVIFQIIAVWLGAILLMPWIGRARRRRMTSKSARWMLHALGVRVKMRGTLPHSPRPMILVANHVSWLDPQLLNLLCGAHFVAKQEVASYPLFGTIARQCGAIFIRRDSIRDAYRVKRKAAETLTNGEHVAFFPEGTTTNGTQLSYFYPALFQAAIDACAIVQPIAIRWHHADGRLNLDAGFIGDMTVVESLRLMLRHAKIYVQVTVCEPLEAAGMSRRALAHHTHAAIAEQLGLDTFAPRPRRMPWADFTDRPRDSEPSLPGAPATAS